MNKLTGLLSALGIDEVGVLGFIIYVSVYPAQSYNHETGQGPFRLAEGRHIEAKLFQERDAMEAQIKIWRGLI